LAVVITLAASAGALAQGQPQVPEPGTPEAPEPVEGTIDGPTDVKVGPGVSPQANLRVVGESRGTGFKLTEDGKSRAHIGIDAGVGFDANPYSVPLQNMITLDGFAGDALYRVRPRASVVYPGSLIAIEADAAVDYGGYPGLLNLAGVGANTRSFIITRSLLGAGFEVNRGGMFSFALRDDFSFNNDPAFLAPGSTFMSVNNRLNAGLGFRPGGGTLQFKLGASFGIQKFIDLPSVLPDSPIVRNVLGAGSPVNVFDLDNINAPLRLRTDWRFLPKTGVYGELSAGTHIFPFRPILADGSPPLQFPVRGVVGVMGQFTSKISGLAEIGYANPITIQNAGGINFDSLLFIGIVGQAEARWQITGSTYLAGGVVRRVQPTPLYQHLTNTRAYVMFTQSLFQKLVFRVNTGISGLQFGRDLTQQGNANDPLLIIGQSSRVDGHFDLLADISYYLFDWWSFGVTNEFDVRLTNASVTNPVTGGVTNYSFVRNETMLLTSLHY
jgi:hypothetical protein